MNDQINEGKVKSPGLFRRILSWLWVVLLAGLLVVGLIFAAPWKAIALIVIFLAAATILPRVYRKRFWLGVGIVIIAIVVWVFLPDDNKGWRPYIFDKELARLQAKYAVPDSENAAVVYNKILENWKQKEPNEPNLPKDWRDIARKGPWLSKDHPEIAAYIHYYRDTIKQLIQASKFERCSFPIITDYSNMDEQMEQLLAARSAWNLLIASANNDSAERQTEDAIAKHIANLKMGEHLCQQPERMYLIVGIGIENSELSSINRFVIEQDINESYLSELEKNVSNIKHDLGRDLPGFIDKDKLAFKNWMCLFWYEINDKGKVRLNRNALESIRKLTGRQTADDYIYKNYWIKKYMKANLLLAWLYVPESPEKMGEIVDKSYDTLYRLADPNTDWSNVKANNPSEPFKLNFYAFTDTITQSAKNNYIRVHSNYLRAQMQQRATLLIIGLKRYKNKLGNWPEKLEDINNPARPELFTDPVNGGPFVYKRTADNFMLYSKGENGIDDCGTGSCKTRSKGGADDIMFWPVRSKTSSQQDTKSDVNEGAIK